MGDSTEKGGKKVAAKGEKVLDKVEQKRLGVSDKDRKCVTALLPTSVTHDTCTAHVQLVIVGKIWERCCPLLYPPSMHTKMPTPAAQGGGLHGRRGAAGLRGAGRPLLLGPQGRGPEGQGAAVKAANC